MQFDSSNYNNKDNISLFNTRDDTRFNEFHILLRAEIMTKYFCIRHIVFVGWEVEVSCVHFSTWNLLVRLEHLTFDYGSITWGSTSSANLDRLSKLQKRAARVILKSDIDIPSATMFQELGWISVESRIKYNKAVFTYKALNNMTPEYITKLLTPMSQTHSLNLRSGETGALYVPFPRTVLYSGAFSCSAPKLWNSLPQAVRNSEFLNAFKTNVKPLC